MYIHEKNKALQGVFKEFICQKWIPSNSWAEWHMQTLVNHLFMFLQQLIGCSHGCTEKTKYLRGEREVCSKKHKL